MTTIRDLHTSFISIVNIGISQMEQCYDNTPALTDPNPELVSAFGSAMTVATFKTIYKPAFCLGIPPMTNAPITQALANSLCQIGIEYFYGHPPSTHAQCVPNFTNFGHYFTPMFASSSRASELVALEALIKGINQVRSNYPCYACDSPHLNSNGRNCYNLTGTSLTNDDVINPDGSLVPHDGNCATGVNCGIRVNQNTDSDRIVGELLSMFTDISNYYNSH